MSTYFIDCMTRNYGKDYAKGLMDKGITDANKYIDNVYSQGKDYIVTPMDWYAFSVKYPNVFSGHNYGFFRIMYGSEDIRKLLPKKILNCYHGTIPRLIQYFEERREPWVYYLDVLSENLGCCINFSMLCTGVSTCLKKMKQEYGDDRYNLIFNMYSDYYGLGVDVFKKDFKLLSLRELCEKYGRDVKDVKRDLLAFSKYKKSISQMVMGRVEWGNYVSMLSTYKEYKNTVRKYNVSNTEEYMIIICNWYDKHGSLPVDQTTHGKLYDWIHDMYDFYISKELDDDIVDTINKVFPDYFKLYEQEILLQGRKQFGVTNIEADKKIGQTKVRDVLNGVVGEWVIQGFDDVTVDEYIESIKNNKSLVAEPLRPVDWYILHCKYPKRFLGEWYGYYRLVIGSDRAKDAVIKGVIPDSISNYLKNIGLDGDRLSFISSALTECLSDRNIAFSDIDSFPTTKCEVVNVGIDFGLMCSFSKNLLSEVVGKLAKDMGVDEDFVFGCLRVECGVGVDVFTLQGVKLGIKDVVSDGDYLKLGRKVVLESLSSYFLHIIENSVVVVDNKCDVYKLDNSLKKFPMRISSAYKQG